MTRDDVLNTYRYLRIAMPLLLFMLLTSVVIQIYSSTPDCWQRSVSAYYYTPARAVFVGSLIAVGVCLIVYRGNTDAEDVALNVSGFLAIVVALVPTVVDQSCTASNVPSAEELTRAVNNNVTALIITGGVVMALLWWFRSRIHPSLRVGTLALWPLLVSTIGMVAFAIVFALAPSWVQANGHSIAAITLFVGIVVVVLINAIGLARTSQDNPPTKAYANRYLWIAIAMLLSFVAIIGTHVLWSGFTLWFFWLEAVLLLEFAGFWVVQTVELWDRVQRNADSRSTLPLSR
jgi:hypothetical protein